MPRYKIVATDQSYSSSEIVARDAGGLLHLVDQLACKQADVMKDDAYCFSVRLDGNGLWTIYQRYAHAAVEPIPAYG